MPLDEEDSYERQNADKYVVVERSRLNDLEDKEKLLKKMTEAACRIVTLNMNNMWDI